ncbi:MAG: hypothetical protein C4B55_01840 [Candidatus Methanophagaceae archaeon]|nr:MAG: hypothetical protein C4B55_01840 [Methanophagales archaeon]
MVENYDIRLFEVLQNQIQLPCSHIAENNKLLLALAQLLNKIPLQLAYNRGVELNSRSKQGVAENARGSNSVRVVMRNHSCVVVLFYLFRRFLHCLLDCLLHNFQKEFH